MNPQKKNKPSYSFKNIKRDSSERFLILGVSEYRKWIPRKTNKILGLFQMRYIHTLTVLIFVSFPIVWLYLNTKFGLFGKRK